MKKLFLFLFAVCLLSFSCFNADTVEATYLHAGESIVISEPIYGDAYILAGNGVVEEEVFGDLYIAGGNITIEGDISEDLVVAGGKVSVFGDIGGDLRVIGGQVIVYGNVEEDVVALGGQLDLSSNTTVGRNLITGAGLLTVDGHIKNNIRGVVGVIFINGRVDGNVTLSVEDSIIVSEDAKIGGDLNYSALLETNIPDKTVGGEIIFNKFQREGLFEDLTFLLLIQKATSYAAMLFLLLVLVALTPFWLINSAIKTKENVFRSFGVGLLTIICVFIGSIILMMTIIGIPIALMALASMIIVFYFSRIFVSAWLASYILDFKKKVPRWKLFPVIALTILFYYLIGMIPFHVGRITTSILFVIGAGSFILSILENLKFLKEKNKL